MRILVTGIEGFVGSHLAELLLQRNCTVVGIVQRMEQIANLVHLRADLQLFECDVRDQDLVTRVAIRTRPEAIVHLAGLSSVAASFRDPETTFAVNLNGSLSVLEAARSLPEVPRVLMIGSCEEYGAVTGGDPITEQQPLRPQNPYAVSKAAQEMLSLAYAASYQLPVVCVRPFHHIGPRQAADFVCASFARQIAAIERSGGQGALCVGNLEAQRDFSDVRDVVQAYVALLESGRPGDSYNVCSERAVSIRWVLDTLLGLSEARIRIEFDETRMRPSDVPHFLGSAGKLRADTGWRARIPLADTLRDILSDWRARV